MELFHERGFDETTVPDITARAGLTTRTFFRHFTDKREVLFADEDEIPTLAARLVADSPAELTPMQVVAHGLPMMAQVYLGRRDELRQRRTVIEGHAGLRERELRKMALLTASIAEAFEGRGADSLTAQVTAEVAVGVVRVALGRWLVAEEEPDLAGELTAALARLIDGVHELGDGRS